MAQPARCEPPPHFEVVDDDGQTVGNAKFATAQEAHDLRMVLKNMPNVGRLAVARVRETMVVSRRITRLASRF